MNKNNQIKNKDHNGITLIALIITIVILLILAGVTINLVLAEGGLVERVGDAVQEHKKAAAREELELKLADMQIERLVNNRNYTEGSSDYDYLTDELWEDGYMVNGDIVTVDEWQFVIDRSVPKIAGYFGKGQKDDSITIECSEVTEAPYTFSTITVKIISEEEIQSIIFNGNDILELITEDGDYTINEDGDYVIKVTENKTYNIYAQNESEKYNSTKISVTEITEDMDIYNADDLLAFRKKVNEEGRTFEGRTVRVMANIDMSSICGEEIGSWEPIGNIDTECYFAGTFNGNYHTISNLYINDAEGTYQYVGLFSSIQTSNAILSNIILNNVNILGNTNGITTGGIGGLVGYITGGVTISDIGVSGGTISGKSTTTGYYLNVGGIIGRADGSYIIEKSYNTATISTEVTKYYSGYSSSAGRNRGL